MARGFKEIRKGVFQKATRPEPYDPVEHAANQTKFCAKLKALCDEARLRRDMTADELWGHVWKCIRYAGFRAAYVTDEIKRLEPFFGDFRKLSGTEWDYDRQGNNHGVAVREFLTHSGRFKGISYSKLKPKLKKIIETARYFCEFPQGTSALKGLFGSGYDKPGDDTFRAAHKRLADRIGFTAALHVMTDVGFQCVKPDIWVTRLMCRRGWIKDVLPAKSLDATIKKDYLKPKVAWAVISRAREVAREIDAWNPESPLREIDLVMAKYGQVPEPEFGIVRSLYQQEHPETRERKRRGKACRHVNAA